MVLLVNTLAADEKYPVLNRNNLRIPFQMQLHHKKKTFSQYFHAFLKSTLSCKHFQEKDDPHRFCISEITYSENVVRWMSQKSNFRGPFDKQHGKRAKALSKPASQHLYYIDWSLANQLSWKKFLLLTCKILVLLVNTFACDGKYTVLNQDNLMISIKMQLSKKKIPFFWILRCIFQN